MNNKYIIASIVLIAVVFISYVINFYFVLDQGISSDTSDWAALGDYVGGLLNPVLSFITIILLIKSLGIQVDANKNLIEQVDHTKKIDKIKSFETLFFHMLSSQRDIYDSLDVEFTILKRVKHSGDAVIEIENEIQKIRKKKGSDEEIASFLDSIDPSDKIYSLSRVFYVIVKMICEKLSDEEGFDVKDRRSHYESLINFTDFAHLRLIMICVQFLDYPSTIYIKENEEFSKVIYDLKLGYDLY